MIRILLSFSFVVLGLSLSAQSSHKLLRIGDKNYNSQDFASAEESYRKSLEREKSHKGKYNLGNTVYNQNRHEEAIQYYEEATSLAKNDKEKSDAFYNLGNAQFRNQQLKESIESYKQSLRLNPEDIDARKNLFLAKMAEQQMQQQQQEQQQQNDQDQNDQENDQQQQQEQQDNQQQQENQDQPQQEGQENPIENNPESGEQQQQQELSKEDAERLLQIIENEEKKVQEKLKKVSGKRTKPDKDW